MPASPHLRDGGSVRGEIVPGAEPTRTRPPGTGGSARGRRNPVTGLARLARRLGARARRPAAAALGAAVPTAVAVATPVARAVGPVVGPVARPVLGPVLGPVLRPIAPLGGALAAPLGKVSGDPRQPRPLLALRLDGHDLPVVPEVLARLARDGSGRVLVLVPAAGGDERVWQRGRDGTGATYGERLADLLGWSPLTLRYDAGADLTDGALALSALLQRVADGWPVPVTRLVLVTEGDGGLLARGALGVRQPGPKPWIDPVTELVALDVPQLGTDHHPGTGGAEIGRRLEQELAGLVVVGREVIDLPPLDHVDYLLVSDRAVGRVHPAGRVLGGLLRWRHRSRPVHDLFPTAERFEVPTDAQPLVNHPDIHDALLRWLA